MLGAATAGEACLPESNLAVHTLARLRRLSVTPGVGETGSVPEVMSVLSECAAASTRTARVGSLLKP